MYTSTEAMHHNHAGHPLVEAFQKHRTERRKSWLALTVIGIELTILAAIILY